MKIALEASRFSNTMTGIGYFLKNFIQSIPEQKSGHLFYLFHSQNNFNFYSRSQFTSVSYYCFQESLAIYLRLNSVLKKYKTDLFHATANIGIPPYPCCPCVTTIHDLFPVEYPNECPPRTAFWFNHFIKYVKAGTRHYMADSKFTADKINKLLDIPYNKITVIPLGAPKIAESTNGKKSDYFLQIGAIEPRKGHETMLRAWREAKSEFKRPFQWIIAGPLRRGSESLYNELKHEAVILDYVSDEKLSELYRNATALVMPSFYEGFGLPVLEAMAYGTPVICSNAPALLEIAKDSALIFPIGDGTSLKDLLIEVHDNASLQQQFSMLGIANAAKYNWSDTTKQIMQVYEDAV